MSTVDTTVPPAEEQVAVEEVPMLDSEVAVDPTVLRMEQEVPLSSTSTISGFQAFYIPIILLGVLIILFVVYRVFVMRGKTGEATITAAAPAPRSSNLFQLPSSDLSPRSARAALRLGGL